MQKDYTEHVHTAEAYVYWQKGANIEKKPDSKCITKWRGGANSQGQKAEMRFNPNNEEAYLVQSERKVPLGKCKSYADFVKVKCWTEKRIGGMMTFTRVDFAVDYPDTENADVFRKMCDLLVAALIVKDNVSKKNQYYGSTLITREHKNAKASGKYIEIERYNKAIQKPGSGILWRLELRYIGNKKCEESEQINDIVQMLEVIAEELINLKKYRVDVLEKMNEALYRDYQKLQKNKGDGHINLTQFMIENEDRIFSGKQLSRLAQRIGAGKRFGNNFGKRNKHIYITEKAYISFIDSLVESIEKWVHREPTFTIVENRIVK